MVAYFQEGVTLAGEGVLLSREGVSWSAVGWLEVVGGVGEA